MNLLVRIYIPRMNILVRLELGISILFWGLLVIVQSIAFLIKGKQKIYKVLLMHWKIILPCILAFLSFTVVFDTILLFYFDDGIPFTFLLLKVVWTVMSIAFLSHFIKKNYPILLEFRFASGAIHLLAINSVLILLHTNNLVDVPVSILVNLMPYIFFEFALFDPPKVLKEEMLEFNRLTNTQNYEWSKN